MKIRSTLAAVLLALTVAAPATAQQDGPWTFQGLERIDLDGVSGDIRVMRSPDASFHLELVQRVRPADRFSSEVVQQGTSLRIEEHWRGRNTSGDVTWTLQVPADASPAISLDTASGDLEARDVNARYSFDTASGDIRIRGGRVLDASDFDTASGNLVFDKVTIGADVSLSTASGDVELTGVKVGPGFDFSTASGDVRIEGCQGIMDGSTASGNVRVRDTALNGPGRFSSASGDVSVRLSTVIDQDLRASSASGDVTLDVASFPESFTLILIKREDRGRIDCPFPYTTEDTFEQGRYTYVKKVVTRGSGGPTIELRTASGDLSVRGG